MTTTPAEQAAMRRALTLAATPGVPLGPNPRVGCVLLDAEGVEIAEGFHRGAGTPHAEVAALTEAGEAARGATAVVTLEPCNHTGRTGPCVEALIAAGVRRVVFAQRDPNPVASGGAAALEAADIEVEAGVMATVARGVNRAWTFAVEHQRPFVTRKFATTLDGRSAAADGTSRWISGTDARRDTHSLRAECDVLLVGTGTVLIDNPRLNVRDEVDEPVEHQPLRVVMGERGIPNDRRIFEAPGEALHLRTRDPRAAPAELYASGRQHVWLEGGPTLAAAFLKAGLIDEIYAYVAPTFPGAGANAVGDLGINTINDQLRWHLKRAGVVGTGADATVRLTLEPSKAGI
ncbi:bifunctional diaminohydroxyphosphoribosylaminopyrimidine deaminase/5-amino-6-(5-phosphoribosylamino)uracil reductase RibD [Nocardioides sp. B-3]|uniref:bifunctional diaminohydroxyphosphoribosylaminopyrimidine deaminase/5-amino-6-(5-phosphoribosylamino)uracil reductase RibD n=1 Tax=Nocardioides sp. B-3 TaxID=2895565 RepID=UPI002152BCDF|nr:bifunctional diaminohydroxyphosphoribosylaminopyrimidine deaminase/5-amino-6-(5-phosphoribosylamino)uracil reductase RibD [Nocardioides sp. B-3]UUZ58972.1 bifunctional diaminohydroxyphosphoribosylaminopyrimidine deaminase/5-amino-6-(5-phosphoribosylamino)uracil reductase RibD [Nocardioides sp. B-3]